MRAIARRKAVRMLANACIVLAVAAVPGAASGTIEEPAVATPVTSLDHENDMRMSDLFGMDVYRDESPRIGVVADAIVDLGQGAVGYLIVRFTDETVQSTEGLYPVPLYLFRRRADGRGVTLLLGDETYLENMPTLEQAVARATPSPGDWGRWLYSYWNTVPPYGQPGITERRERFEEYQYRFAAGPRVVPSAMVRATELLETPVEDAEGRNIGRLDDAVLNLTTSQLLLLNLRPAARAEATADNYLVPVAAFTGNRETTTITYDIAEYGLTGPSGFTGSWPEITSNEYHARLARFWNTRDVATRYGAGMAIVPVRLTSASTLTGYELFSRESTSPGAIVDTLVNPDGSIDYVLIEFGEFLGTTDRRSAVPVSLLSIQPGSVAAVLNVLAGDLSGLPRYPDGEVINTSASGWDESIRRYWNNFYDIETGDATLAEIPTVASAQELSSGSPLPASALLGFEVVAGDGSALGSVDSLQIDLVDSSVGFAVVSLSDGLFGGARVPVPVPAMEWRPAERSVVVDATRDQLEQAPGYDSIPAQPELGLLREIETYWSQLGE